MVIKFGKKYSFHIVGFKLNVRYCWVGFYWENSKHNHHCNVWICLIPMIPFQFAWGYGKPGGYVCGPLSNRKEK